MSTGRHLSFWCGALSLAIGLCVILGWLLKLPFLVQLHPSFSGMVTNAAACFSLLGGALMLPVGEDGKVSRTQARIAWAVLLFAALILMENLIDADFGIDNAYFHRWLGDANPRPGRIAPSTCLGLVLSALVLILMRDVSSRAVALTVPIATFSIYAIALTGLVWQSTQMSALLKWTDAARMPVLAALAMMVVATGLWSRWVRLDWYRSRRYLGEVDKLTIPAVSILVVVGLSTGVAGLAAQQHLLEQELGDRFARVLASRAGIFNASVNESRELAAGLAVTPMAVRMALAATAAGPRDAQASWQDFIENVSIPDKKAVALWDAQGRTLHESGQFAHNPELALVLQNHGDAILLFGKETRLRTVTPVLAKNGRLLGTLIIEQSMAANLEQMKSQQGFGATWKLHVCAKQPDSFRCFPGRHDAGIYEVQGDRAKAWQRMLDSPVPARALRIRTDAAGAMIASYRNLDASGLVLMTEQAQTELFAPILRQIELVIPLITLFVGLCAWLLASQTRPLVRRLLRSEQAAREGAAQIQTVVDNVGDGIVTIDAHGRIETFNQAASTIFGYGADEVIGRDIGMLMPEDLRRRHSTGIVRYMNGGSPQAVGRKNVEVMGLRKDGSQFPLELSVNEMQLASGVRFVGILRDITLRKEAEQALRHAHDELGQRVLERTAELEASNAALTEKKNELRQIAAHQERLKEEERKRIAREIHDELGGVLTGIKSYLFALIEESKTSGKAPHPHLQVATGLVDSAVITVRKVITDLRPSVLDQLGLWPALEWSLQQFESRTDHLCEVNIDEQLFDREPDPEVGTAIFRIVQEALTNIERHAKARHVRLSARLESERFMIRIDDDGIGICAPDWRRTGSWGLVGMRERAAYFKGELTITGQAGTGTSVLLCMPAEKSNDEQDNQDSSGR